MRILLVEDNADHRELMSLALTRHDLTWQVEGVASGAEALRRLAEEEAYDLAFLDYSLPQRNGLEVLEQIRQGEAPPPVVMVTGRGDEQVAVETMKAGAYDYVVKGRNYLQRLPVVAQRAVEAHQLAVDHTRAEEALTEERNLLRTLIDNLPDYIYVKDTEGRFVLGNIAATREVGATTPDELLGKTDFDFFPEELAAQYYADEQAMFRSGQPLVNREEPVIDHAGNRLWVLTTKVPLRDSRGQIVGLVGINRDITERKRAEEEVRRHLERIEALREIDKAIISTLDLTEVLDTILEELERVIPYHSAAIFLMTDGTAKLTAGRGFPDMEHVLQVSFPVEEDALTSEVLREKRPLVLANAQADKRFRARGGTEYIRSWIGVPLIARGRVVGFLTIDHREPGVYDEESVEMVEAFAGQVSIAIENAQLYEAAQRELAERKRAEERALRQSAVLEAINRVFRETLTCETDEEVARTCLAVAEELTGSKFGFIGEVNQAGRFDTIAISNPGWDACKMPGSEATMLIKDMEIRGIDRSVIREGKSRIVNDPATHPDRVGTPEGHPPLTSFLGVPLKHVGKTIGMIGLANKESGYDLADQQAVEALSVAFVEALNRKRAQEELQHTLEKLRKTLGATIQAMAVTVETKDPYTAGHQRQVANLARVIATEMGLSKEQIEGIRMAAVIHDIGKITVPTDILNKPGRLTGNEFGIIQCHPKTGYDILKTIEFPWPIARMVFQHHERMDGSGYPQGLSGEEIILGARILAIADVVEAMASHRPYRPARGLDKALEEISQNRGVLYDPEAVDACLKLFTVEGFEFE